ncbi:expressed ef-hand domain-containing [Micractinium conductrix]|uniref:Expressed ef-hand domain-containing n=1 Tax=Micractinium conductrix TaxID=554055 RepID=A0A2P6VDB0_9CHLO|nr:expressed ef-hand domain-containing [Micractinium conductrix]|eukprot:PSC72051.1 expressed ef-hand domain-containing [Micractinium conductrix]
MTAAVMHQYQASAAGPAGFADPLDGGDDGDSDAPPLLLVTTVDIGNGEQGRIELRVGDHPVDVARAFCLRHGLPDSIVLPLAQHLEENLAENAAAAAAAGTPLPGYADSDGGQEEYPAEEEEEEEAYLEEYQQQQEAATPAGAEPLYEGVEQSARSEPSLRRPGSAGGYGSQVDDPLAGSLGGRDSGLLSAAGRPPMQRPATAAASVSSQRTFRPAALSSARGSEFFNSGPPGTSGLGTGSGRYRAGGIGATSGALPAHNRLYADHFRKQQRLEEERRLRDLEAQLKMEQVHIAPVSNKLAGNRNAGSYRNYGERLYVEGRLEAMRKEQMAQRVKEEEAAAELEGATFTPNISKLAKEIKASEGMAAGADGAYQRLYQRAQGTAKRQERMETIRRDQDAAEVAECSFRPRINPKSARLVEQRQTILRENGLAGFEQLYNDGLRRKMKLEALAAQPPEEATFMPQVNTSSVVLKKLMEGREGDGVLGGNADVTTRLLERGRRYQEKLAEAQRQADEAPRDAATGLPLFHPKTHRPPQYERNPEGAPIGEYLYSIKAEWEQKAAAVRGAQERRAARNASSTFVNDRSERLVDRLKRERFRAVFEYLRQCDPAPVVNLLDVVQDDCFMDTIDPEVRADIEYAGSLLAKSIARRQASERLCDCATSARQGGPASVLSPSSGIALESARSSGATSGFATAAGTAPGASAASAAQPAYAQSTSGELDCAGFVALMEDVVGRTRGLTRQYLLPMPSARQKFEEPSFRPSIDPHSQALAARIRPPTLPAHELLYKTAEEQAAKREEARRAAEEAKLKECLFHPVMVTQPKGKEGRALRVKAELTQVDTAPKHTSHAGQAPPAAGIPEDTQLAAAAADLPAPILASFVEPASDQVHFDALERQINAALVRLSLSEEQMAASLRQASAEAAADAAPMAAPVAEACMQVPVAQSVDANGYSLDWRAICGTPTPDGGAMPEAGGTPGASSMAGFNPLDDGGADASSSGATVAWQDLSEEVVAHVDAVVGEPAASAAPAAEAGAAEELLGLDLHALASSDLPEHHEPAELAQQ